MAPWADTLPLNYVSTMWDIEPTTHSTMSRHYHWIMYPQCGISVEQPMAPWADTLPLNYVPTMWDIDPATHGTMSRHSTTKLCIHNVGYRSSNPWHHEQTLYYWIMSPQCGISIKQPMAPWADTLPLNYVYTMWDIDPATHGTMSRHSTTELCPYNVGYRSSNPWHHEQTLYYWIMSPQCGISIQQPMALWADTTTELCLQCGISSQQPMALWADTLPLNLVSTMWDIDPTTHITMSRHYHWIMSTQCGILSQQPMALWADTLPLNYVYTMWDINRATHSTMSRHTTPELCPYNVGYRSSNPWHHEQTLYH